MKYLLALLLLLSSVAHANTYYVRSDGGTKAQCDGLSNTPYKKPTIQGPAVMTGHCAWANPMVALPATYYDQPHNPPANISDGDTLYVAGGTYRYGFDNIKPIAGAEACNAGDMADCDMQPPPNNTHIIATGPVRLIPTGGAWSGFNLSNTTNVEIAGFELAPTVHCKKGSNCPATGDWGANGLVGTNVTNFNGHDLLIHDFANEGIHMGKIHGWHLNHVKVIANAEAGIDLDCHTDTDPCLNDGTMLTENFEISLNGCVRNGITVMQCYGQEHSGYGDGFGTWHTAGRWLFKNGLVTYNVSDGLDCLYCDKPGSYVLYDHITAYGNAGNQLKAAGTIDVFYSNIDGNCAQYWSTAPSNNQTSGSHAVVGKYTMNGDEICRAEGVALSWALGAGLHIRMINDTIVGQADLITTTVEPGFSSSGSTVLYGNLIVSGNGQINWPLFASGGGAEGIAGSYYYPQGGNPPPAETYSHSSFSGLKNNQCPAGTAMSCANPKLVSPSPVKYDGHLLPGSPALNTGDPALCAIAKASSGGPAGCNMGAN